jgi:hypothetical protein
VEEERSSRYTLKKCFGFGIGIGFGFGFDIRFGRSQLLNENKEKMIYARKFFEKKKMKIFEKMKI